MDGIQESGSGRPRWPWVVGGAIAIWVLVVTPVAVLLGRGDGDEAPEEEPDPAVATLDDVERAVVQVLTEGEQLLPQTAGTELTSSEGFGSGFVMDDEGTIVTAAHVVAGAEQVEVRVVDADGEPATVDAEVVASTECHDVAVLDIDEHEADLPHLALADAAVSPGAELYVAGYPEGDPEYTLTEGIVSRAEAGEGNGLGDAAVFETDAEIRPGNSGGPVIDPQGRVLGVAFAELEDGLGLAIDATTVADVVDRVAAGDELPSLGLDVLPIGLGGGLWVSAVNPGGAGDAAGLVPGDLVLTMADRAVGTAPDLSDYCDTLGDYPRNVDIEVLRPTEAQVLSGAIGEVDAPLVVTGEVFDEGGIGQSSNAVDRHPVRRVESPPLTVYVPRSWGHVTPGPGRIVASPVLTDEQVAEGGPAGGMVVEDQPDGMTRRGFERELDDLADSTAVPCEAGPIRELATDDAVGFGAVLGCGPIGVAAAYLAPPDGGPGGVLAAFTIVQPADVGLAYDFVSGFRFA